MPEIAVDSTQICYLNNTTIVYQMHHNKCTLSFSLPDACGINLLQSHSPHK